MSHEVAVSLDWERQKRGICNISCPPGLQCSESKG